MDWSEIHFQMVLTRKLTFVTHGMLHIDSLTIFSINSKDILIITKTVLNLTKPYVAMKTLPNSLTVTLFALLCLCIQK